MMLFRRPLSLAIFSEEVLEQLALHLNLNQRQAQAHACRSFSSGIHYHFVAPNVVLTAAVGQTEVMRLTR